MKNKELKAMDDGQLHEELVSIKKELFNLRVQRGTGQTPKPHLFGIAKRKVAQIMTILNQRVKE